MSETAKFLTPEQAARVDHSRFDAEKIDRPTITYWQGAWRRLKKNPLAVVAMVMLAVVLFFVLLGPTINGQEYIKINASKRLWSTRAACSGVRNFAVSLIMPRLLTACRRGSGCGDRRRCTEYRSQRPR